MRTLVYGLGESGIAAARLLMDAGEPIRLADKNDNEELRKSLETLGAEAVPDTAPDAGDETETGSGAGGETGAEAGVGAKAGGKTEFGAGDETGSEAGDETGAGIEAGSEAGADTIPATEPDDHTDTDENIPSADKDDDGSWKPSRKRAAVEGVLGTGPEVLEGIGRIVVSPGISPKDGILSEAESRGIPITSEAALGLAMLGSGTGDKAGVEIGGGAEAGGKTEPEAEAGLEIGSEVRVAAVTGTNGKTTAVDMLRSILEASEVPHTVAGNSWRALAGCLDEARETGVLVLELSSFQLHYMESPSFEAAALLNVRPDHMNWHTSFEEYVEDKIRIFAGQSENDLALVSAGDEVGAGAAPKLSAETVVVGVGGDAGTVVRDGKLFLRGEEIASEDELLFAGIHNYENALFAAEMGRKLGATLDGIRAGLLGYRLKPHRMEVVAETNGVLWVDDSKATNPAAAAAALGSFRRPVVLILGGSEKDTDFAEILPHLDVCRAVVCQGEAGPRIFEYLGSEGFGSVSYLVKNLGDAVEKSASLTKEGDAVLLSPGCASFDAFAGYAERGEAFAEMARNMSSARGAVGR
ncbi:MAG: UDP-N-acetylmuramoyl-L-alanine--D-glutamate ligase [Actinomycetota bacterium]|nr:UDP-N-acetylmuramoyl-L-alanine--D-glutamate ligase [Actinomycetota bacterium]